MNHQANCFVFVVCGAREHIDTLHFSLQYLKFHSKNQIVVLTDSTRNEIPIEHDQIVDVKTPIEFNHHQASIYLKTGIHKFLPKGKCYCYLDTDIIACSEEVDAIFNQYVAPITFAPDHCTMEQFSSYAINCSCQSDYEKAREKLNNAMDKADPLRVDTNEEVKEYRKQLFQFYQDNSSLVKKLILAVRFLISRKFFFLSADIAYDRKRKVWFHVPSKVDFMNQVKMTKVCKSVGLKWNLLGNYPMLPDGRNVWKNDCNHLAKAIKEKFNVTVNRNSFQHWNGGVFLFDDQSHQFLDTWFESTMTIFKDPYWKTRDQGTLIKTVWEFGLQNHPTLNRRWNAIADFYQPNLRWINKEDVQLDGKCIVKPVLMHVYHHFGDENWFFWNDLISNNSFVLTTEKQS